jgi:arabinofuranosyltransferase
MAAHYVPHHVSQADETPSLRHLLLPNGGVLLVCFVTVLINGWVFRFLPVDDSFISYRYAVNLARGDGLVYNVGERVEGYTNLLWVLLLSAGAWLGADPVRLGTVLGGLTSILAVFATYRLGRVVLTHRGAKDPEDRVLPAVPAMFLAISPALGVYGFCGLETPLFTSLIVLAASLALESGPGWRDDLLLSSMLFLATLTRPEGALVFIIVVLAAPGAGPLRQRFMRGLRRLALYIAPLAFYLLWKHLYYGAIVPNTAYAKLEPSARSMIVGFKYALNAYLEHGLLATGILVALSLAGALRRPGLRLVHALLIVYTLYVVAVGGDCFPFGRFILPVLPFYYIAVADGMKQAFAILRSRRGALATLALRPGGMGWALVLSAAIASASFAWRDSIVDPETNPLVRYVHAGKWLAEHASPDEVIASGAAGAIAYYSNLRCIDMLGLTDPHIARLGEPDPRGFTPGHTKAAPDYVLSRQPDYVFAPNVYYGPRPLTEKTALVSGAMRGENELMTMPEFRKNYRIENVLVQGKYLGFWRRVPFPSPAAPSWRSALSSAQGSPAAISR